MHRKIQGSVHSRHHNSPLAGHVLLWFLTWKWVERRHNEVGKIRNFGKICNLLHFTEISLYIKILHFACKDIFEVASGLMEMCKSRVQTLPKKIFMDPRSRLIAPVSHCIWIPMRRKENLPASEKLPAAATPSLYWAHWVLAVSHSSCGSSSKYFPRRWDSQ